MCANLGCQSGKCMSRVSQRADVYLVTNALSSQFYRYVVMCNNSLITRPGPRISNALCCADCYDFNRTKGIFNDKCVERGVGHVKIRSGHFGATYNKQSLNGIRMIYKARKNLDFLLFVLI